MNCISWSMNLHPTWVNGLDNHYLLIEDQYNSLSDDFTIYI